METMETQPYPAENLTAERMREQVILQRQTRNAVRFIAWAIGIFLGLSLIGGIYGLVQLGSAANTYNSPAGGDITNCMSLGGNDPSC